MKCIDIRAGRKALEIIRDDGLRPEHVRAVAGAAGGPKWLVLYHFDRMLFGSWFFGRGEPLHLVGSSIGAWRFAAASCRDPVTAVDIFRESYIGQTYLRKPSAAEVTRQSMKILDSFLPAAEVREALKHPYIRLHILAVRHRFPAHTDNLPGLAVGLGAAALLNAASRRFLECCFERTCICDQRDQAPFLEEKGYRFQQVLLRSSNLKSALLASGSIPLVMSGVNGIPGAKKGMYRDGGLVDYHLDLSLLGNQSGIVLYPHFLDRVIPGWFDKKFAWRRPDPDNLKNVLLVSPSREFVAGLPHAKIPDRTDFYTFSRRDGERMRYWNTVADAGRRLAETFFELAESGKIRREAVPL